MEARIFLGKYLVANNGREPVGETVDDSLVFRAQEIHSAKEVVVELVPSAPLPEEVRAQLEIDAIAAQKLDHVNITRLYDFGLESGHYVYVTEHFEGTLAEEWVAAHGPLSATVVLRIASQVVSATEAAAHYHLVHRAINPTNLILLSGQTSQAEWPRVKLLHLVGAPAPVSDSDGNVAAFDKSLHYASPEQIRNGTVDFRSEIYSLGSTMWFLLTGALPPVANGAGMMGTEGSDVKNIPDPVLRLLNQMLAADPKMRTRDLREFQFQLELCLAQMERRGATSRARRSPGLFRSRNNLPHGGPMRMGKFALAALLLVAAAIFAVSLPEFLRYFQSSGTGGKTGVVIGVPDTPPLATPVPANAVTELVQSKAEANKDVAEVEVSEPAPAGSAIPNEINRPILESDRPTLAQNKEEKRADQPPPPSRKESATETEAIQSRSVAASDETASAQSPIAPPDNEEAKPEKPSRSKSVAASDETASAQSPIAAPDDEEAKPEKPSRSKSVVASDEPLSAQSPVAAPDNEEAKPEKPSRSKSSAKVVRRTERKTIELHEVRRGELVEPEVRRAEPVRPSERAQVNAGEMAASSTAHTIVPPQTERNREQESTSKSLANRRRAQTKAETPMHPQSQKTLDRAIDEPVYDPEAIPRSAGRSREVRGKLVGITPDGQWVLALPSNRVIIVPPPEASR